MSSIEFSFNADDVVSQVTQWAYSIVQQSLQPVLDSVLADYAGSPLEVVKTALAERWASSPLGGAITDPELTMYAEKLAAGHRIVIEPSN